MTFMIFLSSFPLTFYRKSSKFQSIFVQNSTACVSIFCRITISPFESCHCFVPSFFILVSPKLFWWKSSQFHSSIIVRTILFDSTYSHGHIFRYHNIVLLRKWKFGMYASFHFWVILIVHVLYCRFNGSISWQNVFIHWNQSTQKNMFANLFVMKDTIHQRILLLFQWIKCYSKTIFS